MEGPPDDASSVPWATPWTIPYGVRRALKQMITERGHKGTVSRRGDVKQVLDLGRGSENGNAEPDLPEMSPKAMHPV
jgi:hypothetical protein